MLQVLIFFIQRFCNETEIFAYFAKAERLWNISVVYIFPIAFNVFLQLMKFYFFTKLNSNEGSFLIRELPFAIFNRSLSVHIRYRFWTYWLLPPTFPT